jgi:NAD+ synthase
MATDSASITIALAQSNCIVGYTEANIARIRALYGMAAAAKADLVVFPEMAVTGYPLEDLAFNTAFQSASMEALQSLAALTVQGTAILIGGLWAENEALYNAAFLLDEGKILHRQYKHHLPNYGVFDEKRIYSAGPMPEAVRWRNCMLGIMICEDMWFTDIATHLKRTGAELLIALSASPFETGKTAIRERIAQERVQETGLALLYVNQAGGQDELVFDGSSFALCTQGKIAIRLSAFQQDFGIVTLAHKQHHWIPLQGKRQPQQQEEEAIYCALLLGLRDFVEKNGFCGILIGMSGGIDSAISAAVATDALGRDKVHSIMMPSPFTSIESTQDANDCASRLGIPIEHASIDVGMAAFETMLSPLFSDLPAMAAANNQPRLRASLLMALSHTRNLLLLNTGNKSEMAVGYTTLYGDMCGHYSVLKDIYKTTVYRLARWRNGISAVIPDRIFSKAPSAELWAGQKDQDTLPPYDILDAILLLLVEQNLSVHEIVARGYDRSIVEDVSHRVFAAEYKRRQSCPGVKVSGVSFYRDRRYPLTSAWRGMPMPLKIV